MAWCCGALAPRWPRAARDAVHALGVLVAGRRSARLQGRAITADWGDAASAWAWLGWLVVPAAAADAAAAPGHGAALAGQRRAGGLPVRSAGAVLAAGLLLVDAAGQRRLQRLGAAAAARAAAQPARPRRRRRAARGLCCGCAATRAQPALAARPALPLAVLGVRRLRLAQRDAGPRLPPLRRRAVRVDAWVRSLAVQTGITLLWTVTALVLMWLSARRALRAAVDGRRGAARRGGAQAAAGRPVGHRHRDAHRLVHRRRRADAGDRLRRAAAGGRRGGCHARA